MNSGKNDNVYMGPVNGSPIYEQKRHLLFLLQDVVHVINVSGISDEYTLISAF